MRKSIAAVSIAAVSITGLGAGFVLASPGTSSAQTPSTTSPATTTPTTAPSATRATHIADVLKPLVTAGTITQAQADQVAAALQKALPAGGRGAHGFGRHGQGASMTVVAKAIGITPADLRTALQGGQTIAQVAQAHNVTTAAVVSALDADLQTRFDKAVTAGTITQAQADQRKAAAATRFTNLVNNPVRSRKAPGSTTPTTPSTSTSPTTTA